MQKYILFLFVFLACKASLTAAQIRPARPEDIETVYDLVCELALFEGKDVACLPVTKESLLAFSFCKTPYFFVEVAEEEEALVGYALYFYGFSAHQGYPLLYIDDLYVKEAYRGCGIGTGLLQKLASYALVQCCRMEWHVFDWNEPAVAFYENLGGDIRRDLLLVRLEKEAVKRLSSHE